MRHPIAKVQRGPNCLNAYVTRLQRGTTVPGQLRLTWPGFVDSSYSIIDATRPSWEAQRCPGSYRLWLLMAESVRPHRTRHLPQFCFCIQRYWRKTRAQGAGFVELPGALDRKYPNAPTEWRWQWVFPATRMYVHESSGQRRRHHLHETALQRVVHNASSASGVTKPISCRPGKQER